MRYVIAILLAGAAAGAIPATVRAQERDRRVVLDGKAGGRTFDGIGVVDGGGATSVLLKDYPEPQRSQILDLMYKPRFGASVSAMYIEVPGDGNSTQGSMPSHMHDRSETNYRRGYTWWVMREAKRRNPALTLDATAWSAPGWLGMQGGLFAPHPDRRARGDARFFSQDMVDYYLSWLRGLRSVHGLELDAMGARNEKGVNYDFVVALRRALDAGGFPRVKLHGFDNWQDDWKLAFVKDMKTDPALAGALAAVSAHMNPPKYRVPADVQADAQALGKPIWNTEAHIYKPGYDALIGIVEAFNTSFVHSGVTKITNWYGIGGVYEMEPYNGEKEAAVRASWPWSGHYRINPALWGYAHYGQFTEVGWTYLNGGSGDLAEGGTFVTLASPARDYSVIVETTGAKRAQTLTIAAGGGLSGNALAVWRSNRQEQFVRQPDLVPAGGVMTIRLDPDSVYSLTTTRGQRKGGFATVPAMTRFPAMYRDDFDGYGDPARHGYLPRYFADIAGAFELSSCPGRRGGCLRQAVSMPPISWAPNWQPYTIIGDDRWSDYEVAADVRLGTGETGGVMGRVNSVGTGYGYVPQGYVFTLGADGIARLAVSRGKENKTELVGDAEQQALIRARGDTGPGGTRILAERRAALPATNGWHRLSLSFAGHDIVASIDGTPVLSATDRTYDRGMAGLIAGGAASQWSRPYYDNVHVSGTTAVSMHKLKKMNLIY